MERSQNPIKVEFKFWTNPTLLLLQDLSSGNAGAGVAKIKVRSTFFNYEKFGGMGCVVFDIN